ncbi:MAG TPA: hypothetical protein PK867_20815, partial [Pirellulales bacterium]|nr:hypothetical protein [Pirellulales bacterium]
MRPLRAFLVFCTLVGMALCARTARAEEPLGLLPGDTAVVVRFQSLDKLASNFKETASTLGPLANPAVEGVERGLSELFQIGADGAAVDRTAPAYLAAFALEGQPEPVVWIVKTPDEAKLRRAVLKANADETLPIEKLDGGFEKVSKDDRHWFFARRGEWVFYTRRGEVAKSLTAEPEESKELSSVFTGRASDLALEGDAAVMVNVARLLEVYGDKLDELHDKLRRQIASLPKEFLGGDSSATDPRAIKKMYSDLADLAFRSVTDAQWATARLNFSSTGVNLALLLGVKADSATDHLLVANPAASLETLGLLPAGAAAYVAMTSYAEGLRDWNRDFLKLAYGEDTDATKQLLQSIDDIAASGVSGTATSFSLPSGVNTSLTTVSLTQAKDAEKYRHARTAYEPAANRQDTPLFSQSV